MYHYMYIHVQARLYILTYSRVRFFDLPISLSYLVQYELFRKKVANDFEDVS